MRVTRNSASTTRSHPLMRCQARGCRHKTAADVLTSFLQVDDSVIRSGGKANRGLLGGSELHSITLHDALRQHPMSLC